MEYWILEPRKGLSPNIHVFNDEGLRLFVSGDQHDPAWRDRVRPPGLYKSTCWIPGNFMAEGTFVVDAAISTVSSTNPVTIHAWERDAVAFQVVDAIEGDSVRGNYGGTVPGVVRPLLKWTTELDPCEVLPSIS
jgi:lipopolysaccharide transport system ATP-binding protein